MLLAIDAASPEPIYLQLVRQVRSSIQGGVLAPGAKLPSHRELALALVVNHLTIKRAFDELEREGLLATRRGLGTYVVDTLPKTLRERTQADIRRDLARAAQASRHAGLSRTAWNHLTDDAWTNTP